MTDVRPAERAALAEAAGHVATTPWKAPDQATIGERIVGVIGKTDRFTRDDAVDQYVAKLNAGDRAPCDALMRDAIAQLAAAEILAREADHALDTATPRMSDVAVVEAAIGDLREARSIYLLAIRRLDRSGEIDRESTASFVKNGFDEAVARLGAAADAIADAAMESRSQSFAGPDRTQRAAL